MTDRIIDEALEFFRLAQEAETASRSAALEDMKFRAGEQWPQEMQNSRNLEDRPCLTINKTDAFCRQVVNGAKQQRPRMKAHGVNSVADAKVAEVITGICRHIEVNSDAEVAYDTGLDAAVTIGRGFFRLVADYTRPDSFEQEIFIRPIENPLSVYWDPNSMALDGSDAEKCMITEVIPKSTFKTFYPNAKEVNWSGFGAGDNMADWVTKEDIRVAEYFYIERRLAKLLLLSNGQTAWEDDVKEVGEARLKKHGVSRVSERQSFKRVVKWCKHTALEPLEERELPGRFIPVIPVYGNVEVIDGKRRWFGMIRHAKDPQMMYNYWRTAMTESIALAPKAKWLLAEGQDEGHEHEWNTANVSAKPVLRYKQRDIDGQEAPPPERLQPESPPAGIMEAAGALSNDLQAVLGMTDPAIRTVGPVSGKALNAERMQSENANYHYYDNLTRSIRQCGRICLDWIPVYYDTKRVMRIIGDDGRPDLVTINDRKAVDKVENDVTVGEYDIVMDTGPGYNTRRAEALDAMTQIAQANPQLWGIAGDLIMRNMDFPGAETIADRLAAANPMAQIDEKSDVPPQAQMAIKQLQQQLQQAQQELQAAQLEIKYKHGAIQLQEQAESQRLAHREENENKRELMRLHTKAHDVDTSNETKRLDTQAKALSAQHVEELRAAAQIIMHHLNPKELQEAAPQP